jgi:hypothetical protein
MPHAEHYYDARRQITEAVKYNNEDYEVEHLTDVHASATSAIEGFEQAENTLDHRSGCV